MKFEFQINNAGHLSSARTWFLDGTLEGGVIRPGSTGIVAAQPERRIAVKSVALVNSKDAESNRLTLSINEPDFPIQELIGQRIVGE